jgi:hypothetical protein
MGLHKQRVCGMKPSRTSLSQWVFKQVMLTLYKGSYSSAVYLLIHVDDAVIVGQSEAVAEVKQQLGGIFDIKDLGEASYFLSIEIILSKEGINLSQGRCVQKVLAQFNMFQCKMKETPAIVESQLTKEGTPLPSDNQYPALVGSLLYLAVNTRPDIRSAVGRFCRFMQNHTEDHMIATKHVLRYLASTRFWVCSTSSPSVWVLTNSSEHIQMPTLRETPTVARAHRHGCAMGSPHTGMAFQAPANRYFIHY